MSCIEKLPHKCGTSDALQVFENHGVYSGYCFACNTYVAHPYGQGNEPKERPPRIVKSAEEVRSELAFINSLPVRELVDRKLRKETLSYFGIRVGLSEEDGKSIDLHFYPYTKALQESGYKVRGVADKTFWAIGEVNNSCDLFGWQQAIASGARRLFVTEGELDAPSLFQALKDKNKGTKWEDANPAVVSLVNGADSAVKILSRMAPEIKKHFKEVALVFDQDEPGKKAVQDVMRILPGAIAVNLPDKDASACLVNGRQHAMVNAALFKAEAPKNTRIVNASTLFESARVAPQWGLSWPWEGLTEMTRGIRFGETYYIGAGVKMGKSEVVNAIGAHLIKEHDLPILMAKPEEANVKTVKMVASKMVGSIFHDPKLPMDYEAYDRGTQAIGNKLYLINLYQHLGWDSLKGDIIEAVANGCKAVFIDPITNLTNGHAAADANTELQDISQQLSAMALDMGFVAFIFCHLKAPEAGPSHERGGKVLSHQFAGSRAMMRSCNLMIGIEGNKDPDLEEEERNMRKLVVLEDREFGVSGSVNLYWNPRTSLFSEVRK